MTKRLYANVLAFLITLAASPAGVAAANQPLEVEIQHLLTFVEHSECVFIRNGSTHDAAQARKHIERKLEATRRYIKSTEDFIRYAATQSSFSGRKYQVRCGAAETSSAQWLNDELQRFRTASP